jgi:serine protease Do
MGGMRYTRRVRRVFALSLLTLSASLIHCGASRTAPTHTGSAANSRNEDADKVTAETRSLTPREIADRSTASVVSVHNEESLGTGFVVRADGWIATNLHVIESGGDVSVTFTDGRTLPVVEIVNASREHDLAILRVETAKLPVLPLGDSERVRPGDPVVAIGHPLGFEDTVSNGLVSALRHVNEQLDVLQISAPIAPGSSGGPLFDDRGRVIGVATAIIQGGQNLNLALPVKYVSALLSHPEPIPMSVFSAAMSALRKGAPRLERHVPRHALTLLKGCSAETHETITRSLAAAIEVGAPLYNGGDFAACYHVYEGAALDLTRRLPKACAGPKRALSQGRERAAKLSEPSAQAWAMRDAFDGLLEVIARRMAQER